MRITAALLALATVGTSLTVGASPALAQEQPTISVRYLDLNLANSAGRATLATRIRGAADRVCGTAPAVGLGEIQAIRACRAAAVTNAWDQIASVTQSGQVRGAR